MFPPKRRALGIPFFLPVRNEYQWVKVGKKKKKSKPVYYQSSATSLTFFSMVKDDAILLRDMCASFWQGPWYGWGVLSSEIFFSFSGITLIESSNIWFSWFTCCSFFLMEQIILLVKFRQVCLYSSGQNFCVCKDVFWNWYVFKYEINVTVLW